jgi:hypothetical protein
VSTAVVDYARSFINLTATDATLANVVLERIVVASSTSGTIAITDSRGTILATMSVAAKDNIVLKLRTIGTVTITIANTLNCTVFYNP